MQAGHDRAAQIELADTEVVQRGAVREVAVLQLHGVVDRGVLEVEPAGDAGADDFQYGYLGGAGGAVQEQGAQHPGAYGAFGTPAGAVGGVLVR